jgi:hypothetical protein
MTTPRMPKLRFLHPHSSLSRPKLDELRRLSTDTIKLSLLPGAPGCLKVRPDGTVLDGHHRIYLLIERGEDVEQLPREIISREDDP